METKIKSEATAIAPAPPTPDPAPPPAPPPPAPKSYWRKEVLTSKFIIGGRAVPFEGLDGNQGVLVLDPATDGEMIAGLSDAVARQVGGIFRSSAQEIESLKKKYPWTQRAPLGADPPLKAIPSGPPKAKPQSKPVTAAVVPPANPKTPEDADDQRPPDRPDFEKFIPKTARIGAKDNAVVADV
jgi:hypothetical protein